MFLLIFFTPLLLSPIFIVKKIYPEKTGLQSFLYILTHIQDSFIAPYPSISLKTWFSGKFQEQFSNYFSQNFLIRKLFIKITNQIYYSLFDKSYMYDQSIIIGKKKWLYELAYIQDYCRLLIPLHLDEAESLAKKLEELQRQLNKRRVKFLVLITPSKASLYPQYIPDVFINKKTDANRDYENLIPLFKKYEINYVDGHEITLKASSKTKHPLFCRGGTHWNYLGAFFTVEKLIKKIETLKKIPLPHIAYNEIKVDMKPKENDRDLAYLLHLLFPPYDYITPHPSIRTVTKSQDFRGSIVFVGTSFIERVYDILCTNKIFKSIDYYFYYKNSLKTFPRDFTREHFFKVKNIDWERDIIEKDIIVLEINEIAFKSGYIYAFLNDAFTHINLAQ